MKNLTFAFYFVFVCALSITCSYFIFSPKPKPGEWKVEFTKTDTIVSGDRERAIKDIIKIASRETEMRLTLEKAVSSKDTAEYNRNIKKYLSLINPK